MRSFLVQLVVVVLRTLTLPSYVTGFRSATWLLPPPPQQANHHRHSWWYPSCSPPQHVTTTPLRLYRVHRTKGLVVICQNNNNNNNNVGTNELSDKEPEVVIQIEDLALSQIAELIEVSFIQACMQLSQGYVDVLKLFIVSVKSAYQRCTNNNDSSSSSGIRDIVAMVDACPNNTAGRPLTEEEVQLRTTWIYAVALMLDHIQYPTTASSSATSESERTVVDTDDIIAKSVQNTYGPILSSIVDLQSRGDKLKTQEFMTQHQHLLPAHIYDDDVQLAIASQTVKVLYYTLTVLEEERLANDSEDSSNVARPQIPRGDSIN